ncbi:Flp pilus assembly complex ATPase component TadA [Methylomonas sp. LL1]|uniref:ATPase, T2SS/T4P/T4SS family n=1 Tax=Methylomonas sp. LL1 TaxID=2785785 RepID=UPI0018C41296|nr:ATPase, T2SS/T4P/T4SS family [Methylomonas sp. LL1]QPK64293.1 Flp pilus assembly complex ATPase component TadA [Methylomonas sp. LL1]
MSRYSSLFTGGNAEEDHAAKAAYRILFVDDEPNILSALRRIFRRENYHIDTALSGAEALQLLKDNPYQLVISDYKMPVMNGAELLKRVKALHPATIRIMLTGEADTGAVLGAINEGAVYKFILKPWNDDDLRITVGLALEQYDLIEKNNKLKVDNNNKTKEIKSLKKLIGSDSGEIAILLNKKNLLSDNQLQELFKLKQNSNQSMLKLILNRQWVDESAIRAILRKDLMVEEVSLAEFQIDSDVHNLLPRSICEQHAVLPLKIESGLLLLAMADPVNMDLQAELRFMSGLSLRVVMANVADIQKKIDEVYGAVHSFNDVDQIVNGNDPFESIQIIIEEDDAVPLGQLLQQTAEPPAIRLVNAVIIEAIHLGASDVHIQPRAKNVVVRYRIDGILQDKIYFPHHFHGPLVSRIKIMAEMDISERRRPQDGRVTVKTPTRIIDLRISTLPIINGEKVVMRILDQNASIQPIDKLGFSADDLLKIDRLINKPQGIILCTGPTGSGKTSTLYSFLQHGATPTKNFVTLEEPVEYYLDAAGQVNIKGKIELTFPVVLRAILRQDPDVILLGEIRDLETAEVAFQAALTGHLVFSTLHTNSAIATIARLFDLGLKPYILSSSLEGIISQRLVRRICEHCKAPDPVDTSLLQQLGPGFVSLRQPLFKGKGCERCGNSGYHGRLCLFELLIPNEEMRDLIVRQAGHLEFKKVAIASGYKTILDDAVEKVSQGLTTCDEVLRVLGPQVL